MKKHRKSRALSPIYESPNQLFLSGFENPFDQQLNPANRWVVLSHLIPWDEICSLYRKHVGVSATGRPGLSPRVVLGSLIIKHLYNLDDRETVDQISENIYMQYFLGYSSFSNEAPFDASLFVDFRNRLGLEALNAINERILSQIGGSGTPVSYTESCTEFFSLDLGDSHKRIEPRGAGSLMVGNSES